MRDRPAPSPGTDSVYDRLSIGWLTFDVLKRLRANENTHALGKWSYLSLRAVGADWGEAEWTAADLVRGLARAEADRGGERSC